MRLGLLLPRRGTPTKILLVFVALLLLGVTWTFVSPHGSSADDDFHLTSIWCAHGISDYCQDAGDGQGVFAPRIIAYPACFVEWPARASAGCTTDLTYDLIYTQRGGPYSGGYPPGFHWMMGFFAGSDVVSSVLTMRIINVLIAAVLLALTLAVVQPSIRRAVTLSWGVAVVPVGIFFIASTNPSSWMIIGIGLYWALLLSVLRSEDFDRKFLARGLLTIVVVALAVVSRRDAAFFILVSTLAVAFLGFSKARRHRLRLYLWALSGVIASIVAAVVFLFPTLFVSLDIPGAQTATDQPNPLIKILLEIPSFMAGMLGGQEPNFIMSNSGEDQALEGYRPTGLTYGIGWTEFSLPSVVGVVGSASVAAAVVVGFTSYSRSRILATAFVAVAVVGQIFLLRALAGFDAITSNVQPRYIFPLTLVLLGISLLVSRSRLVVFTRVQGVLIGMGVLLAGSIAWLASATRYAVGPNAAFTNFGQTADWWWESGPSRLIWFLVAVGATTFWAWTTIWNFGSQPLSIGDHAPVGTRRSV